MIQLRITMTGKGYHPSSEWQTLSNDLRSFANIGAARVWLSQQYGTCKRVSMYRDIKDKTIKVGYIYSFRADDISHIPVNRWIQQDWVEFQEVTPISLL